MAVNLAFSILFGLPSDQAGFLPEKRRMTYSREETHLPLCSQNRKEALFYSVTIPMGWWNNWINCGNSALQKKKNPVDGGGKEEEGEWQSDGGIHLMERTLVLCRSVYHQDLKKFTDK